MPSLIEQAQAAFAGEAEAELEREAWAWFDDEPDMMADATATPWLATSFPEFHAWADDVLDEVEVDRALAAWDPMED